MPLKDEALIEVGEYHGQGYHPLIDFGSWRVAVLRYLDEIQPERIDAMERHTETDEVFVLLAGRGILIVGGRQAQAGSISSQIMEPEKVYNVKRGVWHTILLSRKAGVLLVENRDTDEHNSEYCRLSEPQRRQIVDIARRDMPDSA